MDRHEIENRYHERGLKTEHVADGPGKVHLPHKHEKTYLFTLSGSAKIRLGKQDWQMVKAGDEVLVESNQLHEAVVGPEGWEYVAAWDRAEAEQFKN